MSKIKHGKRYVGLNLRGNSLNACTLFSYGVSVCPLNKVDVVKQYGIKKKRWALGRVKCDVGPSVHETIVSECNSVQPRKMMLRCRYLRHQKSVS